MRSARSLGPILLILLLAACTGGEDVDSPDAARPDAGGVADAGSPRDAGSADGSIAVLDPRPFGMHSAFAFNLPDGWALAREAKVGWTRGADAPYFFWSLVDPERSGDPARMSFATAPGASGKPFDYDRALSGALAAGMNLVCNLAVEPFSGGYAVAGSWLPVDADAYGRFVETVVRRYPAVRVWQVGNEPDLGPNANLADYAALYRLTYAAVKRADPTALVALAGAARTPGATYRTILEDLQDHPIDLFDFHFFGDPLGGRLVADALGYDEIERDAADWRALLDSTGHASTPIWSTENGTPSGTWKLGQSWHTTTEAEQARDLPKRLVVALASGVEKLFWAWGMTEGFGAWDDDFFDHTGLVYGATGAPAGVTAGTPKLAYWAAWMLNRRLEGCTAANVEKLSTGPAQTRAYRCRTADGRETLIAWWDSFLVPGWTEGDTVSLTLPWQAATAVVRPAVPAAARGREVSDPDAAFPGEALSPAAGEITVTLAGPGPVFVTHD